VPNVFLLEFNACPYLGLSSTLTGISGFLTLISVLRKIAEEITSTAFEYRIVNIFQRRIGIFSHNTHEMAKYKKSILIFQ
jgi:hypothetical protein